jgi:hypothetical protein
MSSIIEPAEPNGVVPGQPLVMGGRGEPRQLPSRSPHLDVGPLETLAAITVGIVGLGYVGLPTALSLDPPVESRREGCRRRIDALRAGKMGHA